VSTVPLLVLTIVNLVLCLLLGGGTRAGHLSDSVLQALSIPTLLLAITHAASHDMSSTLRRALLLVLAVIAIPLAQLVPLPPSIWAALPGRAPLVEAFGFIGKELPWLPLTVSAHATWSSLLSLVPGLAVFLSTTQLGYHDRRRLTLALLAAGLASVFLGLLQVAQGPQSPLRFFEITNPSEAVGFFANRNHFSALLYCLLMLAAAWAVDAVHSRAELAPRFKYSGEAILPLLASFTMLVAVIAGQTIARSRAGLLLTIVALCGAALLARPQQGSQSGQSSRATATRLIMGAVVVAVVFAVQFSLYRIAERFAADPLEDARIFFAQNTTAAAKAYMPWGSGLGTFVPVYGMFERPETAMGNTYANRAHNDLLELWLEAGAPGLIVMALFLIWLISRALQVWWLAPGWGHRIDRDLARASTVILALVIAHSFVDYPLRTSAMMAVFAFAAALLVPPPGHRAHGPEPAGERNEPPERAVGPEGGSGLSRGVAWPPVSEAGAAPDQDLKAIGAPTPPGAGKRWGEAIEWPEAWRKPSDK